MSAERSSGQQMQLAVTMDVTFCPIGGVTGAQSRWAEHRIPDIRMVAQCSSSVPWYGHCVGTPIAGHADARVNTDAQLSPASLTLSRSMQ